MAAVYIDLVVIVMEQLHAGTKGSLLSYLNWEVTAW